MNNPQSDREIIKSLLCDLCKIVDTKPRLTWCKDRAIEEYTYARDEYDRRMNPIDYRLFLMPRHMRILGEIEPTGPIIQPTKPKNLKKHPKTKIIDPIKIYDVNQ
jgi:hypothetical protein